MSTVFINDTNLTNIANSIRSKLGSESNYYPSEMSAAINSISTGPAGLLDTDCLNFCMPSGGNIQLIRTGSPTTVTLEYSLDGAKTWTEWIESSNTRSITLLSGQTVYIRNTSTTSTGFSTGDSGAVNDYYRFTFSDYTYAFGYVESLLCKNMSIATLTRSCFRSLFANATKLVKAPDILSNTTIRRCFFQMFYGCTGLLIGPTSLKSTTAAIQYSCYDMFYNCSNLLIPPILYFSGTGASSNYAMFYGCSQLKFLTVFLTTNSGTNGTYNWLNGVSGSGDFYCPQELVITSDSASGIPVGWTRHNI